MKSSSSFQKKNYFLFGGVLLLNFPFGKNAPSPISVTGQIPKKKPQTPLPQKG